MIQVLLTHLVDGNLSVSLHFTLIMTITEERRRVLVSFCSSVLIEVMLQRLAHLWRSRLVISPEPDQRHRSVCVCVVVAVLVQVLSDVLCEAEGILALCEHAVPPRDASLPPHCSRTRRTPGSRFDSDLDSLFLGAGQKV